EAAAVVAGEATLLVGGDPVHLGRCEHLFAAIATKVVRVGRVGDAGLVASLAASASLLAHAALCEALIAARSSGIAPDVALSAIEAARPEISSGFVREQILSRRFDVGRSLADATIDVDRALRAAGKTNVPALFLSTLRQALALAHRQENGRGDVTDLFGALEALSRVKISKGPSLQNDEVASGH
ncbi:MAG TPA: NAD-binding protein, partial [Beijerinckiaceae bacterium]|nr:NAD-binding protein [Beijerinckiaceae bacterium]